MHRWTAEEGRHAQVIRDYLTVTRAVDPNELEDLRMAHMQKGFTALHPGMLGGLAYVSFQELATRVSHRNTGKSTGDPVAEQMFARIALDENLHMIFYRNMLGAAFDLAPDDVMGAVRDVVLDFKMPGHDIPGFQRKAVQIAVEGIYDLRQHKDEVLMPVLRHWKVFERTDLGPEGEKARQQVAEFLDDLEAQRVQVRGEAGRPQGPPRRPLSPPLATCDLAGAIGASSTTAMRCSGGRTSSADRSSRGRAGRWPPQPLSRTAPSGQRVRIAASPSVRTVPALSRRRSRCRPEPSCPRRPSSSTTVSNSS